MNHPVVAAQNGDECAPNLNQNYLKSFDLFIA